MRSNEWRAVSGEPGVFEQQIVVEERVEERSYGRVQVIVTRSRMIASAGHGYVRIYSNWEQDVVGLMTYAEAIRFDPSLRGIVRSYGAAGIGFQRASLAWFGRR